MQLDTAEVKKVGSKHYPGLAEVYKEAAGGVEKYASDVLSAVSHHDSLQKVLETLGGNLHKFLDESGDHLQRCGDVLVDMADELETIDSDNSHNIDDASEGFDDKEKQS